MTTQSTQLTPNYLIAAASSILEAGGYQRITKGVPEWSTATTRLFEDEYNVVGVAAFQTCGQLVGAWSDLQGSLVEVISRRVGPSENKAWDGYLALMTGAFAPSEELEIEQLRYNTTRLRKLVLTGEDLSGPNDIDRLLGTLLPLRNPEATIKQTSVLAMLPDLMAQQGIGRGVTESIVRAFQDQKGLMEALHRSRGGL